jgi:hypothetical protein
MTANYNFEALLSERLLREARWAGQDGYPTSPQYSTELEGLLGFLQAHNRLDSFWPRLTAPRPQERDDALQEIRVARFLTSNCFRIALWEPPGNGNFIGEFSVQAVSSLPIFVELKSPGWEGQLSQEQRDAGRAREDKYENLEGGADDPWRGIRRTVRKAYPKFLPSQPNLLVIADDRFVPLATWGDLPVQQALFLTSTILDGEAGYFTTRDFENLGGIALFKAEIQVELIPEFSEKPLRYEFLLYPNPMARIETALPYSFIEAFVKTRSSQAGQPSATTKAQP